MSATTESAIVFQCQDAALVGVLHSPPGASQALGVVIVVGGPQYRAGSHRQFVLMGRALAAAGWPVFRFDYRGMGDADGEMRTFESVDNDIRVAIDRLLAERRELEGVVLLGLCDAASAISMYCASDPRVRGLVLMNPWVRTAAGEARAYLRHYYVQRLLQPSFWRKVFTGRFNPMKSARGIAGAVGDAHAGASAAHFIDRMLAGLRAFKAPVLTLISERDLTAQEFVDLCARDRSWQAVTRTPNVRVVRLEGADHTFSSRDSLEQACAECCAWLAGVLARRAAA